MVQQNDVEERGRIDHSLSLIKGGRAQCRGGSRKFTSARSLDVTLAYLKGKDAESEEAQEHANSSSLALYA
jgi:hypothetical protein